MVPLCRKYISVIAVMLLICVCVKLTEDKRFIIHYKHVGDVSLSKIERISEEDEKPLRVGFVGVEKCGTQTLFEFTRQHPDIYFLTGDHICKHTSSFRDETTNLANVYKVIAFRDNSCWKNPAALDGQHNLRPQKIVLLLCDPVFRAFSMYMHRVDINP
uniref:Sulfotransferase n=1 Tax=Ciona savignyi TaxID=51511 RepID=H2YRQ4_CIOSA